MVVSFCMLFATAATSTGTGLESGSEKIINTPVKEDLYVSGGTIVVNASIQGDFVAAGGTIAVHDTVVGDVLVAGGNLALNGFTGDDIRAAGGTIKITNDVAGDVVVAGGKVEIGPHARIFGNLILLSGEALVNGTVKGNMKATGGEIFLNGTVEKELQAKGGKLYLNGTVRGKATLAATEIILQDNAQFHQEVAYWQKDGPQNFDKALVGATARFRPDLQVGDSGSRWYFLGFGSFLVLLLYLASALLLLFVLQYVFAPVFREAGATLEKQIPRKIGYGLLYLFGLPLLAVLLLITVIGIPIGLFALFFYAFTVAVAHVITSLVVAGWYNSNYQKGWSSKTLTGAAFVIFVLIKLLTIIPFAGWLLSVLLISIAFGAIINYLRHKPAPLLASQSSI